MTVDNGHVYRMHHPDYGTLHCVAVDGRPTPDMGDSFLALRVTVTSQRHDFPGWVRMNSGDPCAGYVVVYDLDRVDLDEIKEDLGPLSADTWFTVKLALRRQLGL